MSSNGKIVQDIDLQEEEVLIRFQIPKPGHSTKESRVVKDKWTTSDSQIKGTLKDFWNVGGNNTQLWIPFNVWALQYAGLFSSEHLKHVEPQEGLNADNVAVSLILPSGIKKLHQKRPDIPRDWSAPDKEAVGNFVGIEGTINPAMDYSYTSVEGIKKAREASKKQGNTLFLSTVKSNGKDHVTMRLKLP